jgi:hypothetical protein
LHATTTAAELDCAPWWLHTSYLTGNCPKQCTFPSHTVLVTEILTINPLLMCLDPRWIPLGKCAPITVGNCTIVIPPSESTDKGLKLSSIGSYEMGWKDFPRCNPMISRESQMHPPQLPQYQWLKSIIPSSQLGRRGINGFSLTGTIQINLMLNSYTLYLDKCGLTAGNWITAAEVRWKIWMIFPVTRVCLSKPKLAYGCIPLGIHKDLS